MIKKLALVLALLMFSSPVFAHEWSDKEGDEMIKFIFTGSMGPAAFCELAKKNLKGWKMQYVYSHRELVWIGKYQEKLEKKLKEDPNYTHDQKQIEKFQNHRLKHQKRAGKEKIEALKALDLLSSVYDKRC